MCKSVGFLQDEQGNDSAVRLMSICSLVTAIAFGSYTITHVQEVGAVGINLTFLFITYAFGGKVAQKLVESESVKSRSIIQANKQLTRQSSNQ
jgi:hypothetical protein